MNRIDQLVDTIKGRAHRHAWMTNQLQKTGDIVRNRVNYGCLIEDLAILQMLGCMTDEYSWEHENRCLICERVEVDCEDIYKNENLEEN